MRDSENKRADRTVAAINRYAADPKAAMRQGMPLDALNAIGEAHLNEQQRQRVSNYMRVDAAARAAIGAPDPFAVGQPAPAPKRRKR